VYLIAALSLLALIAASTGAMVAVVVAHAQRVSHQRDGVQALYLAEMGVEEMLSRHASGEDPVTLSRSLPRAVEAGVPAPDRAAASAVALPDAAALLVGSYDVSARADGQGLRVQSRGLVVAPSGRMVERQVRVVCRREAGRWIVRDWQQVRP
jgi:hypothetical protein